MLVTLWDGFWANDAYYRSGSRSATTPGRGNPPSDQDLATAFTVPEGTLVRLAEVSLALSLRAGPVDCTIRPAALRVRVPRNRPGVPDPKPIMDWKRLRQIALTMPLPGMGRTAPDHG